MSIRNGMRSGGEFIQISSKFNATENIYSDDEGEGAESEAVCKDQKRRVNVLQAVIDEVKKANTKYAIITKF